MLKQDPLIKFARGFHQDVMVGLRGLPDLAADLLENLSPADKQAFRLWLSRALAKYSPSELKGMLNRAQSSIHFSSGAAQALLRSAADELGLP
jgi:hypothetical protein